MAITLDERLRNFASWIVTACTSLDSKPVTFYSDDRNIQAHVAKGLFMRHIPVIIYVPVTYSGHTTSLQTPSVHFRGGRSYDALLDEFSGAAEREFQLFGGFLLQ